MSGNGFGKNYSVQLETLEDLKNVTNSFDLFTIHMVVEILEIFFLLLNLLVEVLLEVVPAMQPGYYTNRLVQFTQSEIDTSPSL
jgi:hypothetical protein